jgi:hypothetical protein
MSVPVPRFNCENKYFYHKRRRQLSKVLTVRCTQRNITNIVLPVMMVCVAQTISCCRRAAVEKLSCWSRANPNKLVTNSNIHSVFLKSLVSGGAAPVITQPESAPYGRTCNQQHMHSERMLTYLFRK